MITATKRVFLVLYQDKNSRMYEGDCWNAYTFSSPEDADEMEKDLQSGKSAWRDEAVIVVRSEIDVPIVAVM